ncbi:MULTISPECIES: alpha-L-fucosidase [unclassified Streptomyces]|uniref:alpha-L-fucosidase n=1 Tax=unclassified Streptomyces TaxID=2593676 RepID=UPI002E253836
MLNQLYEVLTAYGPVDEVWFEDVMARENEWSVIAVKKGGDGKYERVLPYNSADEGSREALLKAQPNAAALQWFSAECDVSIRPGWFYHADQQPKSVAQLADLWYRSMGRGAVLLLNIPPDTNGLLPAADVARLKEFRERTEHELPADLARDARVTDDSAGTRIVELAKLLEIDRIRLPEDIRHGQQVEHFVVEAEVGGLDGRRRAGHHRRDPHPAPAPARADHGTALETAGHPGPISHPHQGVRPVQLTGVTQTGGAWPCRALPVSAYGMDRAATCRIVSVGCGSGVPGDRWCRSEVQGGLCPP